MKTELTAEQKAVIGHILANATPEKLAQWWCQLNIWKMPTGLIIPGIGGSREDAGAVWEIVNAQEHRIGERLLNLEWIKIHPGQGMEMCGAEGCDRIASYGKRSGKHRCTSCYQRELKLAKVTL